MDPSSIASDLNKLEKSWSGLDWWLDSWTLLVVVGVAVELAVIITEYAHGWLDFKRGTIHSPEKPSILLFGLGFLGAALVAIGVAGEFQIHVKAGKIETDMRDKTRQLVAIADDDAANAKRDTAQLQLRATELEEQILEQGPRDLLLYGKRADMFVGALREFKEQKVEIRRCQFNGNEVLDTAKRLVSIFKLAKWRVSPRSPDWGESNCVLPPNPSTPTGLWIGSPSTTPTPATRQRIGKLLEFLKKIPLAAIPHFVRPDTVRGENGQSIPERYDDPDSIVVVVLSAR